MTQPYELHLGDSLEVLKNIPDNSVDSIVTDPPYGISFMGKRWDYDVPSVGLWQEVLRVLKPGGHALVACGTRTQHRMAVNLEDAGFEIRDIVAWVYGSGFPKSLNIGKAVDKMQGNGKPSRYIANNKNAVYGKGYGGGVTDNTPADNDFNGFGTALKPAMELFTLCRKPLSEKTVAENVLKWGTGGINIDGCRVGTQDTWHRPNENRGKTFHGQEFNGKGNTESHSLGRFPANFIHDGSEEVTGLMPNTKSRSGSEKRGGIINYSNEAGGDKFKYKPKEEFITPCYSDSGSAARFFYCAKASKGERNEGLEGFEAKRHADRKKDDGSGGDNPRNRTNTPKVNFHPTVKPVKLMEYLCRLITPKGGIVLDPFTGSGSTGIGAINEGFRFIGIEREEEYCKIANARIQNAIDKKGLFSEVV